MTEPQGGGKRVVVRRARHDDLDVITRLEIEITRISFGDEAILDEGLHRRRVEAALGDEREGAFVAETAAGEVCGWAWLSLRVNSLSHVRYGNFRSLAVTDNVAGTAVASDLVAAVVDFARGLGVDSIVGRVHVSNLPMRTLYRQLGFEVQHLTMRKRLG